MHTEESRESQCGRGSAEESSDQLIMIRSALVVLASIAVVSHGSPMDMAIRSAPTRVFDAQQLEQSGTGETRLPVGSIEFRSPQLWRDYRAHVIVATGVGVMQTLLIVALMFERRRRQIAEQDAQRHLDNAAHLDRRATLGELSAALAHELSQPLGAIMHNAEAAEMAIDSGQPALSELRDILADIRREDSRAGQIISRMRALLRKHELDIESLDVNALTRETIALVVPAAAEKGVDVDMDLTSNLAPILGDRVHLQQVLLNVLLNGMDAMATLPQATRRLLVRTDHGDHCVEVSVKDVGCGIAPDAARRIFEPFFTTKAQGLGVGLSIAHSIIQAHGGRIYAENNRDRGTTVRFSIPFNREAQPAA